MRKKISWEWEQLDQHTRRVKVIGGWIVHCYRDAYVAKKTDIAYTSESMQFVPDKDHEWIISAPFNPSDTGKLHTTVKSEDFESK